MRYPFGIIGATGATGQQVAIALLNVGAEGILLGGRNISLLTGLRDKSSGTVRASVVNIENPQSLDAFCAEAQTIVNCAGPVSVLGARVAEAALRNKCHYIDPSGLSVVPQSLEPVKDQILNAGLSFVSSAGWSPGLTELLPAYAYDLAKEKFGSVERVSVFFGDWGHWSDNAVADVVSFMQANKRRPSGLFRRGEWKADRSAANRTENLGEPLVEGRFASFYTPELESLGRAMIDADFGSWAHYCDSQSQRLTSAVAMLPIGQSKAIGMIRQAYSGYQQPVGGFAVAKAETASGQRCTVLATFGKGRDYELQGSVVATAANLIAHGSSAPGVRYFWEAFHRPTLIEWLKSEGVRISETFDAG